MFSFFIAKALAETAPAIRPVGQPNQAVNANNVINNVYTEVLGILLLLAGGLAVIYIVWNGILYITSAGSAEKAKAARSGVINGVFGVMIVVAAFGILRLSLLIGNWVASILR